MGIKVLNTNLYENGILSVHKTVVSISTQSDRWECHWAWSDGQMAEIVAGSVTLQGSSGGPVSGNAYVGNTWKFALFSD